MSIHKADPCAIVVTLIALAAVIGAAETATARAVPQASFMGSGGIRDWRADGNQALFIQASNGKWFRVELMSPCIDLPYAEDIGLITRPAPLTSSAPSW